MSLANFKDTVQVRYCTVFDAERKMRRLGTSEQTRAQTSKLLEGSFDHKKCKQ